MSKKLALLITLAFVCSIKQAYCGPGNTLSELSTKFRYALYLLNDVNAEIIREFLLVADHQVRSCLPVKFYQGRYYRVYLSSNDEEGWTCGYLCDDVQMLPGAPLPANTPYATPGNTPIAETKSSINLFFPADDRNAPSIPEATYHSPVICCQSLSPSALSSLSAKIDKLHDAECDFAQWLNIPLLEEIIANEKITVYQEEGGEPLFVYLKKRTGMKEDRIFFTHNRSNESDIMMVIRRSFPANPEEGSDSEEFSEGEYVCLEVSIPVGTSKFATVEELLLTQNEYHSLPTEIANSPSAPNQPVLTNDALIEHLQRLELNWVSSNPIDNPMVERVLGTGISSVVVSSFYGFRSLAFKRLYMTMDSKEKAAEVIRSARINLILLSTYGVPVAPMRYEMIFNPKTNRYAIYCIQRLYQPEQFADHFLENPNVSADNKLLLLDTIIHYMNLCDISNGYQLRVDAGFKGYFRVAVDSNYPNYCLINKVWHLIDLSPFFWSVGDHFSAANYHILDMSQSADYYSYLKSLCTNPVQLYVFFCGRIYRPYQKYSRSRSPDHQRIASDWLGLYNYAVQRVATLPQITEEFNRDKWRQYSPYLQKNHEDLWQTLVDQRNTDPSDEFLDGVTYLVSRDKKVGHSVIFEGAMEPWQQPPEGYLSFIEDRGYMEPVDYLSTPEEQRSGKRQADIFDIATMLGFQSPKELFDAYDLTGSDEEKFYQPLYLEFLRVQALMKLLSQKMADNNNERAANRKEMLQRKRETAPPPPPVLYTQLTAMSNEEMSEFLNLQFHVEYLPVDSDGNCMWNSIAAALNRKGHFINPQALMAAVISGPDQQTGVPAHEQNWGNTDFVKKILLYLASQGIHFNIVIIQPYGSQMVGVWYGLVGGELTIQPLGNDPARLQEKIQDQENIILVNHQNGNDGDFQVAHWGAAVPMPPVLPVSALVIPEEASYREPIVESLQDSAEDGAPSPKKLRMTPPANGEISTSPEQTPDPVTAISPPDAFADRFKNVTGLTLLPASGTLPHPLVNPTQGSSLQAAAPLTHYRNLLLSLVTNYLFMCNKDTQSCGHQLDGMLSLLPDNQNIFNQDLSTGSITPFLHLLTALLKWMNPQPVHYALFGPAATEHSLTEITLVFPKLGNSGSAVYAGWRLILESTNRGYLHVRRLFIPELKFRNENLLNKRHLYFVTNIPVTSMGNLAWPFHAPWLAQWWLAIPQTHAVWMAGVEIEAIVLSRAGDSPAPDPRRDFQKELSEEVSNLDIDDAKAQFNSLDSRSIVASPENPDIDNEGKPQEKPDNANRTAGEKNYFFPKNQHKNKNASTQEAFQGSLKLPVSDVLSISRLLIPILLFSKHNY